MKCFFVDDSVRTTPVRPKVNRLVAVGGLAVECDRIWPLEHALDEICRGFGFPLREVFKWSPNPQQHWMGKGLVEEKRVDFQREVLRTLGSYECKAVFVAEDSSCAYAENTSTSAEIDVVKLLIERVDGYLKACDSLGLVVCDRPGGDHRTEETYLASCLETLREGTAFQSIERITLPVLTSPYRLSRILQAADLITSCTLAQVSGEDKYSSEVFPDVSPLFIRYRDQTGGFGVKLHPFRKLGNLYHWLFGDTHHVMGNSGVPMPRADIAFSESPDIY